MVIDMVGVALSFVAGIALLELGLGDGTTTPGRHVGLWVFAFIPLYPLAFGAYGLYTRARRRLFATSFPDLAYLAHALVVAGGLSLVASHLLRRFAGLNPPLSLTGVCAIACPALITVPLVRVVGATLVRSRNQVRSRVIIVGSGIVADSVARRLGGYDDVELLGWVDDVGPFADDRAAASTLRLGSLRELPNLCLELEADRVIVAFSPTSAPMLADVLRILPANVLISVVPRLFDILTWRSRVDEIHGLPVMDVAPPILGQSLKRGVDLVVATAITAIGMPLWIAIAILIKVTSPGPVCFRQLRTGRGGKAFWIYKFRTMRVGADEEKAILQPANEVDGPLFKIHDDPRVTRVGRVLRALSLDEFPQLINVLRGDMSLVGPRPFVVDESSQIEGWALRRFDVRPGMTGLWQVSGRNDLPFEELRRLDYAYVASWSLWWDLKIMWQTPGCVLRRRGAY